MATVTIFGSARPEEGSAEYGLAYDVGHALARRGWEVCNGGYGGTMAAAARGARAAGGRVVGVTLRGVARAENAFNSTVIQAENLLARIDTLIRRADGFVVLPGGTGTLAEIGLLIEYLNKRLIAVRPVALVGPFWRPVIETVMDEAVFAGAGLAAAWPYEQHGPFAFCAAADEAAAYLAAALRGQD